MSRHSIHADPVTTVTRVVHALPAPVLAGIERANAWLFDHRQAWERATAAALRARMRDEAHELNRQVSVRRMATRLYPCHAVRGDARHG